MQNFHFCLLHIVTTVRNYNTIMLFVNQPCYICLYRTYTRMHIEATVKCEVVYLQPDLPKAHARQGKVNKVLSSV